MSNYTGTRYNFSGAFMTGIQGVNTGIVIPWGSTSVPSGFLECNGQAVSRATYAALFAVVGTTYGAGDGSTTFLVPDLQDKTVLSKSNNKALASTGGANTVTPTGNIGGSAGSTTLTTPEIAAHAHSVQRGTQNQLGSNSQAQNMNTGSTGGGQSHTHNLSANYTGDAASVLQPYLTLIYIIKT